jgi:hypothetical protein
MAGIVSGYGDISAEIADVVPVGRFPQLAEFGKNRQPRFTDNIPNILGFRCFLEFSPTQGLVEVRSDDALGDGQDVRGKQSDKPTFGFDLIQ